MKIIIKEPASYLSEGDEGVFFNWLESVDAVKNVVGCSTGLELTLAEPVDDSSLRELIALMTRYGVDLKWLRSFVTKENEGWFASSKTYWHKSVFAD